jgi:hypothetical protein
MPLGSGASNSSSGNSSSPPRGTTSGARPKKANSLGTLQILIYVAYAGCGAAIAWFAAMNIAPYKALLDGAGAEMVRNGLVQFLFWLPLLGGLFRSLGKGIGWIAGLLVWGLIQSVEVIPGVLWRNEKFLKSVTAASDRGSHTAVKGEDGTFIKSAKQRLNGFVNAFLRNMWMYSIVAYLVDFAICVWYYPLIPGVSWDKAATLLMLGQWKRVNMGNLWGVFTTLFAVEIVIHVLITVWTLQQIVRSSRSA